MVYYEKVNLRQMENLAAYGRCNPHKMEQYLPCTEAQLEKGCKCLAESYSWYMHLVVNVQAPVPVSHPLHYSL